MNPIVPPLNSGNRGGAVANLQDALLLLLDKRLIQAPPGRTSLAELLRSEQQGSSYGQATVQAITLFQEKHRLSPTGTVDAATADAINAFLDALDAVQPDPDTVVFAVDGRVISRDRAGVGGLRVTILDRNVGGDVQLADTTTAADGNYRATFTIPGRSERGKAHPDLQAVVVARGARLGASEVRYNATPRETLNIVVAAAAAAVLPSELETLTSDLSAHFNGQLRDLKESAAQQDITYLANKTGWDARAVALAALADEFSARTADAAGTPQLDPAFFYALFRAGLPANENALARITPQRALDLWKEAMALGVIPASLESKVPQAAEQLHRLVVERIFNGPALAGLSSLKDLLEVSLGSDPPRHKRFAELHAQHKNEPEKLWETVRAEFGAAAEARLRVDVQLANLTRNNAPLMRKLHGAAGQAGLTDSVGLAELGYFRAAKWRELIGENAVPPEVPGETDGEKRAHYAEVLAAEVRLSFPTMVVAQMVGDGETPAAADRREQVRSFLVEQHGKFEIGLESAQRYIARHALDVPADVSKEIARIQRVYQITPSDAAMNALLRRGVDSARAVARYDRGEFVRAFKDDLGGELNARLTHAKAQQVHNIVLNLATSYLVARTAPQIGVHSAPKYGATNPALIVQATEAVASKQFTNVLQYIELFGKQSPENAGDVIPYATLEALFGEMDYCACDHCRSVLSPAAYLVDLLKFLDLNDVASGKNPLTILLDRRPDIEHLPLTCENTNTPLPYIDLVNETLEYFITNNLSLDAYKGHTTDDATTAEELLASPQFVQDQAYETLAGKHEPNEAPPLLPPRAPLPFHQPLENLRRYFGKFGVSLPEVMKLLRTHDEIERPQPADPANPTEYGWRDILMEELRLSRAEYRLLTDRSIEIPQLYGFGAGASVEDVLHGHAAVPPDKPAWAGLSNAKAFSRLTGLSYQEIVDILKTRFVNPHSTLVPRLEKLGIPLPTLKALKDGTITDAEFDALIVDINPTDYGRNIKAWVKNEENYSRIMSLIVLTDPTGEDNAGSFDKVEFRYANPVDKNKLRPFEFTRLFRFIRLWKKLGWTIEQTDKAITALYPKNRAPDSTDDAVNLQRLDAGFLTLLPRLGMVARVMKALKLKPKKDLPPLLACFAPIDTHGASSLYRQMFLRPAPAEHDSVFADDGFGNFLTADARLLDHSEALRAAFSLTDDELQQIVTALKYDSSALLKIETIGAIFRRGWLARKLKLSVRELLLLIDATGADPFLPPDPPTPSVWQFLEIVRRLRDANVKPEHALYAIWNQDISGKSGTDSGAVREFARTLRAALRSVESEFTLTDDPAGQITRARMALVYGSEATNVFFGFLDNTLVNGVEYDHDQDTLEVDVLAVAKDRLAYDDLRKLLSYVGVMTEATRDALQSATENATFQQAVQGLFLENQKIVTPFFDRYPELRSLHAAYVFFGELEGAVAYSHTQPKLEQSISDIAPGRIVYDHTSSELSFKGVLDAAARDELKAVTGVTAEFQAAIDDIFAASQAAIQGFFADHPTLVSRQEAYLAANDSLELRRSVLLESFLPELKLRRKRQQVLAGIAAAAKADIPLASVLLDDQFVLNPAAASPSVDVDTLPPALDDLPALERTGLSARFYAAATVGGSGVEPVHTSDAELHLAYPATGAGALPVNPCSAIWTGYLEAPENGFYNFQVEPGVAGGVGPTSATLTLDGEAKELTKDGEIWRNATGIELRAGSLYAIAVVAENVTAGLRVRWYTTGGGWEVIPEQYLYSATLVDHLHVTYVRFVKAASLAAALKLTPSELAHLASHENYRIAGRGWLNSLPVVGSADKAISAELLEAFEALLTFATLKAALAPSDERVLAVLRDPTVAIEATGDAPEIEKSLLLAVTRWDGASLDALLLRFGKHLQAEPDQADRAALTDLDTFLQVHRAYGPLKKLEVSASALIAVTTNEPSAPAVRAFKDALRARYEESDWLSVLTPINDEMRSLQRDALVAYVLHQMRARTDSEHIDTPDKLFEYFLMDVQMDPCMQTSRIRHALSSVQLFTERCFMNLETRVAPEVFKPKHRKYWEWMKRYRVWEANRKVFLWPENWAEPELRTTQSPIFKEAMSELLQSDITEDKAAAALLNYLTKLDEVAKLEPCGIHVVEGEAGASNDVAHVVARTAGANRKYFYRRYDGLWSPWEQIKQEIEDNPVIPVVWKGRLFLTWLKILKDTPHVDPPSPSEDTLAEVNPATLIPTEQPKVYVQAVLCWAEYYNGKWQPTKTSDINQPLHIDAFAVAGTDSFDRSIARLGVMDGGLGELLVYVSPYDRQYQMSDGSKPQVYAEFRLFNANALPQGEIVALTAIDAALDVGEPSPTVEITRFLAGTQAVKHLVLKTKDDMPGHLTIPRHACANAWNAPFFYSDSRHAFWVTTTKRKVPIKEQMSYAEASGDELALSIAPLTIAKQGAKTSSSMKGFVSEDAYINKGIPMKGAVDLGGAVIGPNGGAGSSIQEQ